jgi:hypothetical protein
MYGTSTLRISDARPSLQTVGPLYQKTVQQGKRQKLLATVTGRSASLPAIDVLTRGQTVRNQRHLGSKLVRIADIQASEDRSGDFDRSFHPLETHTRSRWLSIAVARLNGQAMPAVDLIKVGNAYAVRDGHHRISVAKALGEDYIDAQVTAWELAD